MEYKPERFLKLPAVLDRTGLGRSMVYRRVADGTFPKPVKLGLRAIAWRETEIDGWIADRIRESEAA